MMLHKETLIQRALEKAEEALNSAQCSIENDFLTTAQNRIYYAIFYSVVALGYYYDFISSKHGQYISWFNKKFIYSEKIFNEILFKIYKEAFESRQKSDYEFTWKPIKEDILKDYDDAQIFVSEIKNHLKK